MTTKQKIEKLINGETVVIKDDNEKKEIKKQLIEIKKNCTIVLSQIKNQ